MEISYDILSQVLFLSLFFLSIYYLLYKSLLFSILDPLFIFILTTSFASVLLVSIVENLSDIIHFFVCQFCLYAGIFLLNRKPTNGLDRDINIFQFYDDDILKLTTYILFSLYILGNLIIFYTKGAALLSSTPTSSKVSNFQDGFGIFRKINWAAGGFSTAGLIYLYLNTTKKKYLLLLTILAFFTSLEGSKASLLRILTSFAFFVFHPYFSNNKWITKFFNKNIIFGLASLLIIFFSVLFKENEDTEQVMFAFIKRLLYSGDSILYYYTSINQNYFSHYSFSDYPAYIMNTILGFLRISSYKEAFGNIMIENVLPELTNADVIVGPNTPFFIEGDIFFGFYGSFLHSFTIGLVYGLIRKSFFTLKVSSSFLLVFLCCLCQIAGSLLVDTSLFVTICFDTFFWVMPIYLFSAILLRHALIIRIPKFTSF